MSDEVCPFIKGVVPESYGVLSPARQAFTRSECIRYFRDEGLPGGEREEKRRKKP